VQALLVQLSLVQVAQPDTQLALPVALEEHRFMVDLQLEAAAVEVQHLQH
jgi:hypothetical protein